VLFCFAHPALQMEQVGVPKLSYIVAAVLRTQLLAQVEAADAQVGGSAHLGSNGQARKPGLGLSVLDRALCRPHCFVSEGGWEAAGGHSACTSLALAGCTHAPPHTQRHSHVPVWAECNSVGSAGPCVRDCPAPICFYTYPSSPVWGQPSYCSPLRRPSGHAGGPLRRGSCREPHHPVIWVATCRRVSWCT
jgi:hypothetical protein